MFLIFLVNFGLVFVLLISSLVVVDVLLSLLWLIYLYLFLLLSLFGLNVKEEDLLLKFILMCLDLLIFLLFLNYLMFGCGFFVSLYFKVVGLFFIIVMFFRGLVIFGVVFVGFFVVKIKCWSLYVF